MRWLLFTGIAAVAVGTLGFAGTSIAVAAVDRNSAWSGLGAGMMGGGMMGGGMMGGDPGKMMGPMMAGLAPSYILEREARTLGDKTPDGALVDRAAKRITFTTSDVHLVVLGSPEGGSDMTFRVAGLADPTVVVPRGATVSVEFINGDADTSHGWELLSGRTSFSYMAMMDGNPAFPGAFAMPLGSTSRSGWPAETLSFTASTAGTYTYICPVAGHAQKGMHGQLLVN